MQNTPDIILKLAVSMESFSLLFVLKKKSYTIDPVRVFYILWNVPREGL